MVHDENCVLQYELLLYFKNVTFLLQLQSLKMKKRYFNLLLKYEILPDFQRQKKKEKSSNGFVCLFAL